MLGCQATVSKITSFLRDNAIVICLDPNNLESLVYKKKVITTHKRYTLSHHKYAHLYNYDCTVMYNNFMTMHV